MDIQIAVITHRHGQNVYAGRTSDEVYEKVADYCREWWERDGPDEEVPASDRDVIDRYFQCCADLGSDEYYETHLCELPDEQPAAVTRAA